MSIAANPLTPEVAALLARAMFPDPERVRRELESYRTDPGRRLFVWIVEGRSVSAAGVRQTEEEVEVLHLGTAPGRKGRGTRGRSCWRWLNISRPPDCSPRRTTPRWASTAGPDSGSRPPYREEGGPATAAPSPGPEFLALLHREPVHPLVAASRAWTLHLPGPVEAHTGP